MEIWIMSLMTTFICTLSLSSHLSQEWFFWAFFWLCVPGMQKLWSDWWGWLWVQNKSMRNNHSWSWALHCLPMNSFPHLNCNERTDVGVSVPEIWAREPKIQCDPPAHMFDRKNPKKSHFHSSGVSKPILSPGSSTRTEPPAWWEFPFLTWALNGSQDNTINITINSTFQMMPY